MFDKNGHLIALIQYTLMSRQLLLQRKPWKDTAYMMVVTASFVSRILDTLISAAYRPVIRPFLGHLGRLVVATIFTGDLLQRPPLCFRHQKREEKSQNIRK